MSIRPPTEPPPLSVMWALALVGSLTISIIAWGWWLASPYGTEFALAQETEGYQNLDAVLTISSEWFFERWKLFLAVLMMVSCGISSLVQHKA